MEAVGGLGLAAEALVADIQGAPAVADLALQPSGEAARAAYLRLQTGALLSDCIGDGVDWLQSSDEAEAPAGEAGSTDPTAGNAASRTSTSATPTSGQAARAAYLRLQTSALLSDCSGENSEWLAGGDAGAAEVDAAAAAHPTAAEAERVGELAEASHRRPAPQPAAAEGLEAAADGIEQVPERPSSAAAEFFQLRPLPPLDNLPAIPLPPYNAAQAEQLPQQQRAPAWQADAWQDEAAQHSDGSTLSLAADAAAAAAAAGGGDAGRCTSAASAALSSPGSDQLPYLEAAGPAAAPPPADPAAGGGATSGHSSNTSGSSREPTQQQRNLHVNAAYDPGRSKAADQAATEGADEEDSGSPAAQLARLLGSPLTPDGSPPAVPGGSASGRASVGSGGRAARITPGGSPAGSPPPERTGDSSPGSDAGVAGAVALPTEAAPPVRSLSQQWLVEQLQREVAALQRQAAELREALAAAEASAAAHAEQAQLLRGQVGSSEERQAAVAQAQAQAVAALAAAVKEQAALQHQAEAEAARRAAAEERGRQLEEQLELMLLERSSIVEAEALGQGDGGLLATAAELAAGNALMAEVQLLRRQLEETSASKRQLAESLREERAHSASLQARLAAATAAAEREAARHAESAAAVAASAAAAHAAQEQQVQQLAATAAALQQQLERGRAAATAGAAVTSLQHQQQAVLADQSVTIAELQRQLHAEQAARVEQAALADAAATQVTQQAAAFSEALLQQQQAATYWHGQAEELGRQLEAQASTEGEVKSALQETCTKLVAQQQLCHEQQEELQFLRLKYQQLSARLEAAEAGAAGLGAGTKAPPASAAGRLAAQQLHQGRGSQDGSTSRSARLLQQAALERHSPASSAGSTPTASRLRRTGSGGSAGAGSGAANGGGSKLGSWLGLRR
ncbi:hypothetical protein ABPG75_004331 [Micractinium tetrahymenae]